MVTQQTPAGPGKLETIQLLRALAVLAVLASHTSTELANMLAARASNFRLWDLPGDFGVDLFFVISGFIMVYTVRNDAGGPASALDFIRRRIIRIVPLYWLMTTVMILVVVLLPQNVHTATNDWGQWLSSYLFIPYARTGDGMVRPVLGLGWTLQYEMYFYVVFAFSMLFSRRRGMLVIAAIMAGLFAFSHLSAAPGALLRFLKNPIALEFILGVFLGWVYLSGWRFSRSIGIASVLLGAAILILLRGFAGGDDWGRHLYYGVPGFLLVTAAVLTRGDDVKRLSRWMVELGNISYATYLTHPFVIGVAALAMRKTGLALTLEPEHLVLSFSIIVVAGTIIAGYIAHYYLDLPMTNWIRRHWKRSPALKLA